ncbi:hypothetical protein EB796_006367 [Bugula neritina]|uniref:WAP domain-containing protein n=1 Tax=Bugula neritina TaxID=10212 RepID=A0A7J7KCJ0_BUGNE|nr:hypothetical protein EB796_006367 [Bugula neritina]
MKRALYTKLHLGLQLLLAGLIPTDCLVNNKDGIEVVLNLKQLRDRLVEIASPSALPHSQVPSVSTTVASSTTTNPRSKLVCPQPLTWFVTERDERFCESDLDCSYPTEKCCDWFDKKHCLRGIDTTPHPGQCSTVINDGCLADHVSCEYDGQCGSIDEKCCFNFGCGYMECQNIRQHLACPSSSEISLTSAANCTADVNCTAEEKCCETDGGYKCVSGISTLPRPGFCPMPVSGRNTDCTDKQQCEYDSQCSSSHHKCCLDPDCGRHVCSDMNRDFACPVTNPTQFPTNSSSSCSDICGSFGILCCPIGVDPQDNLVKHCIPGVLHLPKPGQCPAPVEQSNVTCSPDSMDACFYDSECWSEHKCCENSCGFKDCVSPEDHRAVLLEKVVELMGGA